MQIDWITVSAQIVNFLLLIWLLKRFLYQPVIRAMDQREQRIADRLEEAEMHRQTADQEAERYRQQKEELERGRAEIYANAVNEAEHRKQRLLDEARAEVIETRAGWQQQAEQEKEEFLASLGRAAAEEIQRIARKALQDLADADLEERIVDVFVQHLGGLDPSTRRAMAEPHEPVRIASSFELDPTVRGRLTRAVHEKLATDLTVEYDRAPDLLCGIELTTGGRRLGWNVARYMEDLAERVEEAFSSVEPVGGG